MVNYHSVFGSLFLNFLKSENLLFRVLVHIKQSASETRHKASLSDITRCTNALTNLNGHLINAHKDIIGFLLQ